MGKILPIIIAVAGLGSGLGAGMALRPEPAATADVTGDCSGQPAEISASADAEMSESDEGQTRNYVKLNNQFVVPVVNEGRVSALVVMSLSLELSSGGPEQVFKLEPKIRDAFLQVLFDHANIGGFDGEFTNSRNMDLLRRSLLDVAKKVLGPTVVNVLIVDVVRQDT